MNTIALLVIVPLVIPLIWIIVLLVTSFGAGVAVAIQKKFKKKFDKKGFAILGARATGKTTLHHFLREGTINLKYEQTTKEEFGEVEISLKERNLIIKESTDIGGSDDFKQEWENIIKKSDYIIYIIDSSKLISETEDSVKYLSRIKNHLNMIEIMNKEKGNDLILFASHLDKINGFPDYRDDIVEKISKTLVDNKIVPPKAIIKFGSLWNVERAKEFVEDMFETLITKK